MPIEILMPALSPTMSEGKLAKWHKKEGDQVSSGDVIAEIETDKATMEFEAVDEGVIGKILVPEGTEGVAVNELIALLLEEGEDASALEGAGKAKAAPAPAEAGSSQPAASEAAVSAQAAAPQPAARSGGHGGARIFASPLARRIAKEAGLDLAALKGSGPHGRIVKADVEKAKAEGTAKAAPAAAAAPQAAKPAAPAPAPVPEFGPKFHEVPHSGMRKTIARRLSESKRDVPHFYLTIDCNLDALMALRKDLNGRSDAYKLSVNDFIIRASALALRKVPAANVSWTDTAMRVYEEVDISVAVATPAGLITPVIKNADQKGLAAISNEIKSLAARAREGKLKPEEYQGGGFTISNLGMYGINNFAAIINPPQACILAVGAGEQRPIVKDGALAIATMMTATLSVDHRAVDGAVGAEYLAALKQLIEDPLTMLL
ncbi:pyruvate dehydrogenase complex dihydrolipoamide acetyltransferase [Telmatospirillum sp. J64-1]|uniref:pyruvate dehydrogenase complex dihydrolipoamide acetyltransferase n=1 Tax=Telmatospirillum sp. J64-1 TaxID=2502183 RepID=UPI00115CCFA6|nr:pyruvate dehydrogenase complex dihydrolipoamide acetyltransferase [Telmatospirillum sp. J64-1]